MSNKSTQNPFYLYLTSEVLKQQDWNFFLDNQLSTKHSVSAQSLRFSRANTHYLLFSLQKKFSSFDSSFERRRGLKIHDVHLSVTQHSNTKIGIYHMTMYFLWNNKKLVLHGYYDENNLRIHNTLAPVSERKKDLIIIQDEQSRASHGLNYNLINELLDWTEAKLKPLVDDLSVGYSNWKLPYEIAHEITFDRTKEFTSYFCPPFWPQEINGQSIVEKLLSYGGLQYFLELKDVGAFERTENGKLLYEMFHKKLLDEKWLGETSFLFYVKAVKSLVVNDVWLNKEELEQLFSHPDARDVAFSWIILQKNKVTLNFTTLTNHPAPKAFAEALTIINQFVNLSTLEPRAYNQILEHLNNTTTPKHFAMLLIALWRSHENSSLKEQIQLIHLAAEEEGTDFITRCTELRQEKGTDLRAYWLYLISDYKSALIFEHPEHEFIEQILFILAYKLQDKCTALFVERLLETKSSFTDLYEAIVTLLLNGVLDEEDALCYLDFLFNTQEPIKASHALNILIFGHNHLMDSNLRKDILSILVESKFSKSLAANIVEMNNLGILDQETLQIMKHFPSKSRQQFLALRTLLATAEQRELYIPLLQTSRNPSSLIDVFILFHRYEKEGEKYLSSIENEKLFFRKLNKRILELKSNWHIVVPYLKSLAALMKALDEANILPDLLIDSFINLNPVDIHQLANKSVSFDLIPFFKAVSFFYQHLGSYQQLHINKIRNYKPEAIPDLLLACQTIVQHMPLTPDIVNKLVLMSVDQINEIQRCSNQTEIFSCLTGRPQHSHTTTNIPKPVSSHAVNHYNYSIFEHPPVVAQKGPIAAPVIENVAESYSNRSFFAHPPAVVQRTRKPIIIENANGELVDIATLATLPRSS